MIICCGQSSHGITVLTCPFKYKLSVRIFNSEYWTSAKVYVMSRLFFCEYMSRIEKLSFAEYSVKFGSCENNRLFVQIM